MVKRCASCAAPLGLGYICQYCGGFTEPANPGDMGITCIQMADKLPRKKDISNVREVEQLVRFLIKHVNDLDRASRLRVLGSLHAKGYSLQ